MTDKLVDLLRHTTRQETILPSGKSVLWCPLETGRKLELIIARRGKDLGGLVMQAMRFVRLARHASPNGLVEFLYLNKRLPTLTARGFKESISFAVEHGHLSGIVEADENAVSFLEPEMRSEDGECFNLGYAQMPMLAAFVDFTYLALSPEQFEKICSPILRPQMGGNAIETGIAFRAALLEWLRPRMEREHLERQREVIRKYLEAQGLASDDIDNQVIFDFWTQTSLSVVNLDGFRKFQNAARKILDYRRALDAKDAEFMLEHAASLDSAHDESFRGDVIDLDRLVATDLVTSSWISPLGNLFSPPHDGIKWLKSDDHRKLLSHMIADTSTDDEGSSGQEENESDPGSLFGQERPNPKFFHTLLRFTYFGSMQNHITRPHTKGAGYMDFTDLRGQLGLVEADLRKTIAHIGRLLLERGATTGLTVALQLHPKTRTCLPSIDREDFVEFGSDNVLPPGLVYEFLDAKLETGRTVGSLLRKEVERAGLKSDHWDDRDPEVYETGVLALLEIHDHLQHYLGWLDKQDLAALHGSDLELFSAQFDKLYASASEKNSA